MGTREVIDYRGARLMDWTGLGRRRKLIERSVVSEGAWSMLGGREGW